MALPEHIEELRAVSPGAKALEDGPLLLVHLPELIVHSDGRDVCVEALLCLSTHKGYATRLYLSQPFPAKARNWTTEVILGRPWHSWSWQGVPASHRPVEILAQHLRALR